MGKIRFLNCGNLSYLALPDNIAMLGMVLSQDPGLPCLRIQRRRIGFLSDSGNALYDNVHNRLLRNLGTDTDYSSAKATDHRCLRIRRRHELENVVFRKGFLSLTLSPFLNAFSSKKPSFRNPYEYRLFFILLFGRESAFCSRDRSFCARMPYGGDIG